MTQRQRPVLREIKRRDGLVIFAWALMTNRYNLVVRRFDVQLWRSMVRRPGKVTRELVQRWATP